MKILLVEDDSSVRNILKMSLEAEGFTVDDAEDGELGSYRGRTNEYDIVILDNVLPKKQGKQVCEEIRAIGKHMPILMLSVKSEVLEKVELLKCGVDDYMTKPFSFEELLARIHTLLRRPKRVEETIIKIADIELNSERCSVTRNNQRIYLTKKEFSLLEILMKNKNQVVTRGQIMEHAWESDSNPFSNTVDAHILNLRKKLGDKTKQLIQNIPGRGYSMYTT